LPLANSDRKLATLMAKKLRRPMTGGRVRARSWWTIFNP